MNNERNGNGQIPTDVRRSMNALIEAKKTVPGSDAHRQALTDLMEELVRNPEVIKIILKQQPKR